MLLYHGSPFSFDRPEIKRGKSFRDFGNGFYLAENAIDSESIALKDSYDGFLYTYEVNESVIFRDLRILEFDDFTEQCLEFIYNNRMGNPVEQYDIVIGPTAGGSVNVLFNEYRKTRPSFQEVSNIMKREITQTKFGIQWCLLTDHSLKYFDLVDKEYLSRD